MRSFIFHSSSHIITVINAKLDEIVGAHKARGSAVKYLYNLVRIPARKGYHGTLASWWDSNAKTESDVVLLTVIA